MVWGSLWFAFAAVVFGFAVGAEPAVCGGVVWVLAGGAGVWGWVELCVVDHVRMLEEGVWVPCCFCDGCDACGLLEAFAYDVAVVGV